LCVTKSVIDEWDLHNLVIQSRKGGKMKQRLRVVLIFVLFAFCASGLEVDSKGNIYVVDSIDKEVLKFYPMICKNGYVYTIRFEYDGLRDAGNIIDSHIVRYKIIELKK